MSFRFERQSFVRIGGTGEVDHVAVEMEAIPEGFSVHGEMDWKLVKQRAGWAISSDGTVMPLRAATLAESASLDAQLAKAPSLGAICSQALACCTDGMRALGSTCNPKMEFPRVWSSLACQRFISGINEIGRLKSVTLPASCAPNSTKFASSPLPASAVLLKDSRAQ